MTAPSTPAALATIEALAEKWHREASQAKEHGEPNAKMSKRHAARELRRALAAALTERGAQ